MMGFFCKIRDIQGVPYTLYPIYGVGSTALYNVGHTSDAVKLAVRVTSR
jgi:hypothetical protein